MLAKKIFLSTKKYNKRQPAWRRERTRQSAYGDKGTDRSKNIISVVLLLICFTALFFIWLRAGYFKIKQIDIQGAKTSSSGEIRQFVASNAGSYFFFNAGRVASLAKIRFHLNDIKIEKQFPNKLLVSVQESNELIILDDGERNYLIDSNGNVIKQLGQVQNDSFYSIPAIASTKCRIRNIVRHNQCTEDELKNVINAHFPVRTGQLRTYADVPIIFYGAGPIGLSDSSSTIRFALRINSLARQSQFDSLSYFEIQKTAAHEILLLVTNFGWEARFSPTDWPDSAEKSWQNFFLLWNRMLAPIAEQIEYVDVESPDRAYFRTL